MSRSGFGIKVTEFFVGFGPRIWSTRRGETEYGVKWIPAGGYVKIAGMNPYETVAPEDAPRTFGAKPIWQRALVIVAGPATHFVLAFVLFALWLGFVGRPVSNSPLIDAVAPTLDGIEVTSLRRGPAARRPDRRDRRASKIRQTSSSWGTRVSTSGSRCRSSSSGTARRFRVTLVPVLATVEGKAGRPDRRHPRLGTRGDGHPGLVIGGARLVGDSLGDTVHNLARIFGPEGVGRVLRLVFTDAPRETTDPASVVGIGQLASQTASGGNAGDLLFLFAIVNVFIGFLNLLPLPPFDGGHLAVLAVEKVRGRAVDMRKVIPISVAVAAFFIVFTVSIIYLDIVKPISLDP